jgi:hypothetical protein
VRLNWRWKLQCGRGDVTAHLQNLGVCEGVRMQMVRSKESAEEEKKPAFISLVNHSQWQNRH